MKRLLPFILALLTAPLFAQNTQTSATLTDANGSVIQNCIFTISLVSSTGQDISTSPVFIGGIPFNDFPVSGSCDAFGHFSVPILSNTSFTAPASPNPTGTQYNFSIQSQASPPNPCPQRAFKGIFTVTGTTLDLSAALSALAPMVTCGGPSGPGVTSLKASGFPPLQNAITIVCNSGISCTQSGQTITFGIPVPFAINSFAGCAGVLELGATQTNPAFTASYSVTPASANITNTDGISSPLILSTPFTSGTVTGSFTHSVVATTTFTLTAVGSTTQTASCSDSWQPRIFGGVGNAGATSTVTASGTTAVLSTSDVLPSLQLGAETVGETFGPFSPSSQAVYLLLVGGSHTFTDNLTGFPFAFNAPIAVTFVNTNGVSVTMFLYQSTNDLFLPVQPRVASWVLLLFVLPKRKRLRLDLTERKAA